LIEGKNILLRKVQCSHCVAQGFLSFSRSMKVNRHQEGIRKALEAFVVGSSSLGTPTVIIVYWPQHRLDLV
jgi:hypothetical protein